MWLEIAEGALLLGAFVYHRWIEDHPTTSLGLQKITTPTVTLGAPVPLIYGRCLVRSPILLWSGNQVTPGGGVGDYSIDLVFCVGLPFYNGTASFNGLYAGDVPMNAGTTAVPGDPPGLNRQLLLANLSTPTGIIGCISGNGAGEYWGGASSQICWGPGLAAGQDTFLNQVSGTLGDTRPGLRRMVICLLGGRGGAGAPPPPGPWIIGQSPSVSSYSFEVTSNRALFGNLHSNEADPAAVIADILTGRHGKLGLDSSVIDTASFQASSNTLFSEVHGYSRAVDQATDASEIITDILKQTDGVMYQEPTTGKIVYKLVRPPADVSALADINPDNAEAAGDGWYSVQGWAELPNAVEVTFTDRSNRYQSGTVTAQNPAGIAAAGNRIRKLSRSYPGCCTAALAGKLAARELAANARPAVKATLTVGRSFYLKRPGDAVTLTWPELGINKIVMRVARVNLGRPGNGKITLDLIRDVSGVTVGAFPVA